MGELQKRIQQEIAILRQARDELRVQMDLAKKDGRDQWEVIEKKWQRLEGQLKLAEEDARESAGEVSEAMSIVVDEIKEAYQRIRSRF